jgi:hypothetical protein
MANRRAAQSAGLRSLRSDKNLNWLINPETILRSFRWRPLFVSGTPMRRDERSLAVEIPIARFYDGLLLCGVLGGKTKAIEADLKSGYYRY